jgi:hypothetical protein
MPVVGWGQQGVTPNVNPKHDFLQTAVPECCHFLIADVFSSLGLPKAFKNSRTMLFRHGKHIRIGIFRDLLHRRALDIFVIASEAK